MTEAGAGSQLTYASRIARADAAGGEIPTKNGGFDHVQTGPMPHVRGGSSLRVSAPIHMETSATRHSTIGHVPVISRSTG